MHKTLCLLKPDILKRNLVGSVLKDIESKGFTIVNIKYINFADKFNDNKTIAAKFYEMHSHKPFFYSLLSFTEKQLIAVILEKENALIDLRTFAGATNPLEAAEGTLRKKYGISIDQNSIHTSDSEESFIRESDIIFEENI